MKTNKRRDLRQYHRTRLPVQGNVTGAGMHTVDYNKLMVALSNLRHAETNQRLCGHHWFAADDFQRCEIGHTVQFNAFVVRRTGGYYLCQPRNIKVLGWHHQPTPTERRYDYRN